MSAWRNASPGRMQSESYPDRDKPGQHQFKGAFTRLLKAMPIGRPPVSGKTDW